MVKAAVVLARIACMEHHGQAKASPRAQEAGRAEGYALVGCCCSGVNAFFVRDDLVGDRFCAPFAAENHYEPPRYFLRYPAGHFPGLGLYQEV